MQILKTNGMFATPNTAVSLHAYAQLGNLEQRYFDNAAAIVVMELLLKKVVPLELQARLLGSPDPEHPDYGDTFGCLHVCLEGLKESHETCWKQLDQMSELTPYSMGLSEDDDGSSLPTEMEELQSWLLGFDVDVLQKALTTGMMTQNLVAKLLDVISEEKGCKEVKLTWAEQAKEVKDLSSKA